jgi:LPS-assembly lipoprotein
MNLHCKRGFQPSLWLLLAALLLTGCGFHLRGQAQLPPELAVTHIKAPSPGPGSPPSAMLNSLRQLLLANRVEVVATPERATAILEILREDSRQRTIAGNREGDRQVAFTYTVDFQVLLPNGQTLLPRTTLTGYRDVIYNENNLLGMAEGEQGTLRNLQNEMARSILRRLEAVRASG